MSGSVVHLHGISAWYGPAQVLHAIDLPLQAGLVTAVMGPPNAGKSTLLRVINRLAELEPGFRVQGRVDVDGADAKELEPTELRRRIGMVFERPTAFPRSLTDNVGFGLTLAGVTGTERDRRVEDALRAVGLWEEIADHDLPAERLGAGQRQRLCIARALALQPQALLLDEPTRWLHPADSARLESVITSLRGRLTVLVAVTDASQAGRIADSVALLHDGRLVEHGAAGDVFTNPRQPATQAYLSRRFR